MEFRQLLGNRVYLEIPEEPVSSIILDEQTLALREKERVDKLGRLKVYAVGAAIEGLSEGDEIMIDPTSITKVLKIPLSPDKDVLLISYFDIAHIW
jgi:hypothetical protein